MCHEWCWGQGGQERGRVAALKWIAGWPLGKLPPPHGAPHASRPPARNSNSNTEKQREQLTKSTPRHTARTHTNTHTNTDTHTGIEWRSQAGSREHMHTHTHTLTRLQTREQSIQFLRVYASTYACAWAKMGVAFCVAMTPSHCEMKGWMAGSAFPSSSPSCTLTPPGPAWNSGPSSSPVSAGWRAHTHKHRHTHIHTEAVNHTGTDVVLSPMTQHTQRSDSPRRQCR